MGQTGIFMWKSGLFKLLSQSGMVLKLVYLPGSVRVGLEKDVFETLDDDPVLPEEVGSVFVVVVPLVVGGT